MSIKIGQIICDENRDNGGIAELADNISAVGLINPITLAPEPDGKFRVIAGRRRFFALRALQRQELADSEYRVIEAENCDMIAFCENFQRKDLSIQEELAQLRELADRFGEGKVALLGQELGKGEKWVRTRLRLLNLIPIFAELLGDEKIPISYLEEIGKYPAATQERFDTWMIDRARSAKELADELRASVALKLPKKMPKKCASCPFNTGTDSLLNDAPAACTDLECAAEVTGGMLTEALADFRERNAPVLVVEEKANSHAFNEAVGKVAKTKICQCWGFNVDDKGKDVAIIVKPFSVKIQTGKIDNYFRSDVLFGKAKNDKSAGDSQKSVKEQLKDALDRLEGKRHRKALDNLLSDLDQKDFFALLVKNLAPDATCLPLVMKYGYRSDYRDKEMDLSKFQIEDHGEAFAENVIEYIRENVLRPRTKIPQIDLVHVADELARSCSDLGLDWHNYLDPAIKAIPETKRIKELQEESKKGKGKSK